MKTYKNISKKLYKAYWTGVTDVISCIAVALTFSTLFIIGW